MRKLWIIVLFTQTLLGSCFEVEMFTYEKPELLPKSPLCQEISPTQYGCGCYESKSQMSEVKSLLRDFYGMTKVIEKIVVTTKESPSMKGVKRLSDEELALMYQVFIYSGEHDAAYTVGKIAIKRHPNSLEWNHKMAQVCQWSGRPKEAMKYYKYIYRQKPSKELREKLIAFSMTYYQYEISMQLVKEKMLEDPSEENINTFLYIWEQSGYPDEAAVILRKLYDKDKSNTYALEHALRLDIAIGEITLAGEIVDEMNREDFGSQFSASLRAYYYFLIHDSEAAYRALQSVDNPDANNMNYLMQVSDLGWYLGYYKEAAEASLQLEKITDYSLRENMGPHQETPPGVRADDFDRIINYYQGKDSANVKMAAHKGWIYYDRPYFLYTYAYVALEEKEYESLYNEIEATEHNAEKFELVKNSVTYYLIKAQCLQGLGDELGTLEALKRAKVLNTGEPQVIASLLWFYMAHGYNGEIQSLIFEMEDPGDIDPELYLPLAAAHFHLQHADSAMKYLLLLRRGGNNTIDLGFMYAYVAQIYGERPRSRKMFKEIFDRLEVQRRRKPILMQEPTFAQNYLISAMDVLGPDEVEQRLYESQPYLDKEQYDSLWLFWSVRNNDTERANMLINTLKEPEPWMRLYQKLSFNNNASLQSILYKHYLILPTNDSSRAAFVSGNYSFGYTLLYNALRYSSHSSELYVQFRDRSLERADRFGVQAGVLSRSDLRQIYLKGINRNYVDHGWWLYERAKVGRDHIRDSGTLSAVPRADVRGDIGVKKEFDRGTVYLYGGVRDSIEAYGYGGVELDWKLEDRWSMELKLHYHDEASETVYLFIGGYKDMAYANLSYRLLPSTTISINGDYNLFSAQDGISLGDGSVVRANLSYVLRQGYPDLGAALFIEHGNYNREGSELGSIGNILPDPNIPILPEAFTNTGFNLTYGMQNAALYTRVWRPYVTISPIYNSTLQQITFGADVGIGGLVYDKDHLRFGIDYDQAVNGTNETVLMFYVDYQKLY